MKKICILVLAAFSLAACRKENVSPTKYNVGNQSDITYNQAVIVAIDQTQPGYAISPTFEGLSFEAAILTQNPEYLNADNSVFIQLIKNLGPGILRIGGGTSDEIGWTGTARSSNTPANMLTTSDIDRLSAFSKISGWPVLFGLNLGSYQVAASANEASYVYNSLGSNLYAIQFGNEPDYFAANGLRPAGYTADNYITEWNAYYANVKPLAPKASFAGPDVVQGSDWINSFAAAENSNVKLIDAHYYLTGPATDPSITYQTILSYDGVLPSYLQNIQSASSNYNLPFRITECNNVWGGGKAGVSDIFASALWGLDFMWTVAGYNSQGINFHDGEGIVYSPLTMSGSTVIVHPEYYAMLAFKYGSAGGKIIPANIAASGYNCSAYACANADNSYSITLINKEVSNNISFNIQLSQPASTIQIARLAAPSVTATTNITFAGNVVNANGTFVPGTTQKESIKKKNFTINMPACSAAVVTLH